MWVVCEEGGGGGGDVQGVCNTASSTRKDHTHHRDEARPVGVAVGRDLDLCV
jgi:hypothetical protein